MTAPTKSSSSGEPSDNRRRTTVAGVQPQKPPKTGSIETGVSSHLPWQTPYEGLWEALRTDDIPVRDLVTMRRTDGQARALYRLITLPIRAALKTATFVPGEDVDGGDDEAEFIEQMLTLPSSAGGMVTPFGRVIAQMLMAVFDGFSAFEMVYWQPTAGALKGKWTLQKLAHRPSEQLTFLLNEKSEFAKLRQRTMYHSRAVDVTMDAENVVYYAANEEERPLYGQSYFNAAFHHWEAKFKLYVISHIAAQRAAVGTRVGTMPESPDREEKAEFQRALSDLGVAQWITMSDKFKVESLKEFSGFDFLGYINHHNSQMSKSVLAAFFDDSQGTGGDASLVDFGRQSDALFLLMLQTIMGEVEEVINTQVIPKFIDWNFNSGKYPKFSFGSLTEEQKGIMLDLYKALAVAGDTARVTPEVFREVEKQVTELFGLEIDWEAVQAREEEEAAQAQAMAAAGQVGPDGQPIAGGVPPADGAGPVAGAEQVGGAAIDPANVPDGFTLTNAADLDVTITGMAAELLDDALMTLTRGRPRSGGPKFVRSAEGARTYGVPIGTAITHKMDKELAKHGEKGGKFGVNRTHNPNPTVRHIPGQGEGGKAGDTSGKTETQGGGKGAASNLGGVNPGGGAEKHQQRVFSNPKEPGSVLIDYGDGTVAIKDANGKFTPRQKVDIGLFAKFGWKVDAASSPAGKPAAKADPKK